MEGKGERTAKGEIIRIQEYLQQMNQGKGKRKCSRARAQIQRVGEEEAEESRRRAWFLAFLILVFGQTRSSVRGE
jgi:hypothetical protein